MFRQCDEIWYDKILAYIDKDYFKCLYLYMDLIKYGFNNEFVKIWVDVDHEEKIIALVLKYHSGMHIFSKELNYSKSAVVELILCEKPNMICAQGVIIKNIAPLLQEYITTYGYVGQVKKIRTPYNESACNAIENNLSDLAVLMCQDEGIGKTYSYETMLQQLRERYKNKFSRNIIIFRGKDIAAHVGTGAELNKVAIINGVITDVKYRGNGLASSLVGTVAQDLLNEGKRVFSVYYTKIAANMHHKVGFIDVCDWGKLELSNTNK